MAEKCWSTLAEHIKYEPLLGTFTWKIKPSKKVQLGAKAGSVCKTGKKQYLNIYFNGVNYKAHVLAFYIIKGYIPETVDHKDGNGLNNVWSNLRDATICQNNQNTKIRSDNSTGVKGVSWRESEKVYVVEISSNGVRHYGGRHKELSSAKVSADNLRASLHGDFCNFG